MEELIQYIIKTFDEQTLKVVNFMERTNLLVSEMKMEQVKTLPLKRHLKDLIPLDLPLIKQLLGQVLILALRMLMKLV